MRIYCQFLHYFFEMSSGFFFITNHNRHKKIVARCIYFVHTYILHITIGFSATFVFLFMNLFLNFFKHSEVENKSLILNCIILGL